MSTSTSDLLILRPGYQTWNNDFIQWLKTFNFTSGTFTDESTLLNTDYFSGTVTLLYTAESYYRVFMQLENIQEIDTSSDTALTIEIVDLSSIFGTSVLYGNAVNFINIDTVTHEASTGTCQFVAEGSILFVSAGLTIPNHQEWYITMDLIPLTVVNPQLLYKRASRNMSTLKRKKKD